MNIKNLHLQQIHINPHFGLDTICIQQRAKRVSKEREIERYSYVKGGLCCLDSPLILFTIKSFSFAPTPPFLIVTVFVLKMLLYFNYRKW